MIARMQRLRYRRRSEYLIVWAIFGAILLASVGLGLASRQLTRAAVARDCSPNSIDNKPHHGGCGATSPREFAQDLRTNDPGDLQAIYASTVVGSLTANKYDYFVQNARMGTVYRNGTVVVDGRTVMTGAASIGRQKINSNRQPLVIDSRTYYYSSTQNSFAQGVNSIPAMVLFNTDGVAEVVVLTACGNPVIGIKTVPAYECHALNMAPVPDQKDTYAFTTNVVVAKGASVQKVVYDFGDGSPTVSQASPSTAVRHTYRMPGVFTAKVMVYYNLPGGITKVPVPSTKCTATVTVAKKEIVPVSVTTPPALPKTGVGGAMGAMVVSGAAGLVLHRLYARRKR